MTAVWRWSHMALSLLGGLVIIVASVTGTALGYHESTQASRPGVPTKQIQSQPASDVIEKVETSCEQVFDIEMDKQCRILVNALMKDGKMAHFIANPETGHPLRTVSSEPDWVKWCKSLHRSLFFKTPGRIIVAISTVLLLLISISGLFIVFQINEKRPSLKIPFRNAVQYSHSWGGVLLLLPTLMCAVSAIALSIERFSEFEPGPTGQNQIAQSAPSSRLETHEFDIFKSTPICEIRALRFPVFDDIDEPFLLETTHAEFTLHPYNGQVLATTPHTLVDVIHGIAAPLHTGEGSVLWSIILILTALGLLYFSWSGFRIVYERVKPNSTKRAPAEDCAIHILIASQTGSTWNFAEAFKKNLANLDVGIHIAAINDFEPHEELEHVIFMAATTGYGEPPANASEFKTVLDRVSSGQKIQASVLGFGSRIYPDFAKFGSDLFQHLQTLNWVNNTLPYHTVDSGSWVDFENWTKAWGERSGFNVGDNIEVDEHKHTLQVSKIQRVNDLIRWSIVADDTFDGRSGDHIGIRPGDEAKERLYSLSKMQDGTYSIVFKVHSEGICSKQMGKLDANNTIDARLATNPAFYMPQDSQTCTLISNGTGIGPFMGILEATNERCPVHFYWGCRSQEEESLFEADFERAKSRPGMAHFEVSHSQEGMKQRIQERVKRDRIKLAHNLAEGGTIMICGALQMQHDIEIILQDALEEEKLGTLQEFREQGRFLTDCYN